MICGPLVVTVASNWSICAPNWLLIKPRPATTKPRIAAGPIEASANLAILPIVEVIPPNTDRPVLAAFANVPDKPFILPAKTPINPPALVKALLMIELNEFAFFPMIPNPVPSSPKSVKAGPKANAPTNPAMAGVRLLTASCALDI